MMIWVKIDEFLMSAETSVIFLKILWDPRKNSIVSEIVLYRGAFQCIDENLPGNYANLGNVCFQWSLGGRPLKNYSYHGYDMGDNRGSLIKWFEGRVKLSRGPFKQWFWSLDPTDCDLKGPNCNLLGYLVGSGCQRDWKGGGMVLLGRVVVLGIRLYDNLWHTFLIMHMSCGVKKSL